MSSSLELPPSLIVFGVAVVLTLAGVLGYIAYRMFGHKKQTSVVVIEHPFKMFETERVFKATPPTTMNGMEYAMSMWIHLPEFETTPFHKMIMRRGSPVVGTTSAVVLDKGTNRVYVVVGTNQSPAVKSTDTIDQLLDSRASRTLVAEVDVFPIGQWVHLAFVVRAGLLSVYLDGQLYTVESTDALGTLKGAKPVISGTAGALAAGVMTDSGSSKNEGFITRLEVFGHWVSDASIRRLYEAGMAHDNATDLVKTLTNFPYRVRLPFQKVSDQMSEDEAYAQKLAGSTWEEDQGEQEQDKGKEEEEEEEEGATP